MKILYLVTKSNYGGAQRYVYDLATRLGATESVCVAYGGTGAPGSEPGLLAQKLRASSVSTRYLKHLGRDYNPLKELLAFFEIYSLIKKESPDVIHANSSKVMFLGALAGRLRRVKRVIITIHGIPFKERYRNAIWKFFAYVGTFCAILFAHKTIVVSKADLKSTQDMPLVGKEVICIHNGITSPDFYSREKAKAELLSNIGPEFAGKTLIGVIAELTRNKGIGYAIAAMPEIVKKVPDARLVIIGEGELAHDLQILTKLNRVESVVSFAGYVNDAARLLPAFDLFLLPSIKEGFPYTILEAGAASLPVIASNIGGIPDVIENEKTGLLSEDGNPSSIATHVIKALTSVQGQEMGERLKERVSNEFSMDLMVRDTLMAYHAV